MMPIVFSSQASRDNCYKTLIFKACFFPLTTFCTPYFKSKLFIIKTMGDSQLLPTITRYGRDIFEIFIGLRLSSSNHTTYYYTLRLRRPERALHSNDNKPSNLNTTRLSPSWLEWYSIKLVIYIYIYFVFDDSLLKLWVLLFSEHGTQRVVLKWLSYQ